MMKIYNAFCKYMYSNVKASIWIHCRFQTWKIQREFFKMWGQQVRIQVCSDIRSANATNKAMKSRRLTCVKVDYREVEIQRH